MADAPCRMIVSECFFEAYYHTRRSRAFVKQIKTRLRFHFDYVIIKNGWMKRKVPCMRLAPRKVPCICMGIILLTLIEPSSIVAGNPPLFPSQRVSSLPHLPHLVAEVPCRNLFLTSPAIGHSDASFADRDARTFRLPARALYHFFFCRSRSRVVGSSC